MKKGMRTNVKSLRGLVNPVKNLARHSFGNRKTKKMSKYCIDWRNRIETKLQALGENMT